MGMEMIILIGMMGVFVLFTTRQNKKRKNERQALLDSLQVGDEITIQGGIVGKIVHVKDGFITFETGEDRVRIKAAAWSVMSKGKAAEDQSQR